MKRFFLLFTFIFFTGCVSTIPLTSNINDLVLMSVKTNNKEMLSFEYNGKIEDFKTGLKGYKSDGICKVLFQRLFKKQEIQLYEDEYGRMRSKPIDAVTESGLTDMVDTGIDNL